MSTGKSFQAVQLKLLTLLMSLIRKLASLDNVNIRTSFKQVIEYFIFSEKT